jgi:alkylhydroperoxidase family enzyme
VKGSGYVQVTQEGTTSVVVGTTTLLDSTLGSKQPAISVSSTNGQALLVGNVLASLGDSTTVLPKVEDDGAGGRRIYFQTVLGTSDIGGLQAALDLKAPVASPSFSGQASFANCTSITGLTSADGSIKDVGLRNQIGYQLGFLAPRQVSRLQWHSELPAAVAVADQGDGLLEQWQRGWSSVQVEAAPSAGSGTRTCGQVRASSSVEAGFLWATAGDASQNTWTTYMPANSSDLVVVHARQEHVPGAVLQHWLSELRTRPHRGRPACSAKAVGRRQGAAGCLASGERPDCHSKQCRSADLRLHEVRRWATFRSRSQIRIRRATSRRCTSRSAALGLRPTTGETPGASACTSTRQTEPPPTLRSSSLS